MANRRDLTSVSDVKGRAEMGETQASLPARLPELVWRQRVLMALAGGLAVASVLGGVALGDVEAGAFLAVGIGLSLLNSALTELSMMRMTAAGDDLSRKQFAMSALMRLSAVSLVAFALVFVFWPAGGFVLVGLALFQLLNVALTGFPLLKELRNS